MTWFACIFVESLAFAYWVFLAGGAPKLKDIAPALVKGLPASEVAIKWYAAGWPFFVAVAVYLISTMDVTVPR